MKIILTILILLICSGCTSWQHTALDISNEPYHLTDNNCVHKAKRFALLEPEYDPVLWVVRMPQKQGLHMKVKIKDKKTNKVWWVDPTNGTWERVLTVGVALYPYEEK